MAAVPATLQVSAEQEGRADVGIVGLGVMGSNLVLNLVDKGFVVAIYNRSTDTSDKFVTDCNSKLGVGKVLGSSTYQDFARLLKVPRKSLILVTAGSVTDAVIQSLSEVFSHGDIIVDTGNAHFKDQSRRAEQVEAKGLRFLGMGISGGAEGARKGPAFFPGGTPSVWEDIRPIVEAASAKASDGRPCVTMCGRGGAGSCVKMYHNAGEYAVLQIWAEAVAAMRGAGLSGDEIRKVLEEWKARKALDSYMLDITCEVATMRDAEEKDGSYLLEKTADMIGSKGTGLWSVQVALDVGCPVPSLAAAVLARQMSMARAERLANEALIGSIVQKDEHGKCSEGQASTHAHHRWSLPSRLFSSKKTGAKVASEDHGKFVEDLYWAVHLSIIASYAQMFQCLRIVDKEFHLDITPNLPRIISTFRAGCILQGAMLEPMTKAFEANPNIPNLMCAFSAELTSGMQGFRSTMACLAMGGESAPVMQASLDYLTTMTRGTMTAGQVVALQRDVFGRHGFMRLKDGKATEELHHAEWPAMIP